MASSGHDVVVIAGGPSSDEYPETGFLVKQIKAPYSVSMGFSARVISFLRFAIGASYQTLRAPADLVFASSTPLTVAVPALLKNRLQGTPFIFEVRDLWPSVPIQLGFLKNPVLIKLAEALEMETYRRAHHVVALSPGMANGVRERIPSANVTIVPNAADIARFSASSEERLEYRRELGWGDEEVVFVYAGSFGWTYELTYLVEVAANLRGKGVRFVLLGDGPSSDALQHLASQYGLDAHSLLPGKVSKNEAAKYIQAADAVLSSIRNVPPLHVNSLNKVFDGLAAGKPVVFAHGGWLADEVTGAGAGLKVSATDAPAAARAIADLAAAPETRYEMGKKARDLAENEFDRDLLFERLLHVITRAPRGLVP